MTFRKTVLHTLLTGILISLLSIPFRNNHPFHLRSVLYKKLLQLEIVRHLINRCIYCRLKITHDPIMFPYHVDETRILIHSTACIHQRHIVPIIHIHKPNFQL